MRSRSLRTLASTELAYCSVRAWLLAWVVSLCLLAVAISGVWPVPAALIVAFCAAGVSVLLVTRLKVRTPAFWALAFVAVNFASGLLCGGFESLENADGFAAWVSQEGRVFLYYWPLLFILVAPAYTKNILTQSLGTAVRAITITFAGLVVLKTVGGISTFSSHHGAGALGATLWFFNFYRYSQRKSWSNLLFLALSSLALVGSNSRTALLGVVLTVIFLHRDLLNIARLTVIGVVAVVAMAFLFPYQFERMARATLEPNIFAKNFASA